jgi:catechol 2,3-dioxygenase-like lactoylglutathione lyase family enzyme
VAQRPFLGAQRSLTHRRSTWDYLESPGDEEALVSSYPVLLHTAIDARDCRALGEFYRQLLGLRYREGDEPPTDGSPDDAAWLVLLDENGDRVLAVQEKKDTTPPTWPSEEVPMQMHLDFRVTSVEDLKRHRELAEALGARLLHDRSNDEEEPLFVLADPAGHPFCLLVQ